MTKTLSGLAVATLFSLAMTSNAQAWGSCGRGNWVPNGESSYCSCSNRMVGEARRSGGYSSLRNWDSGPTNSGVGMEMEAWFDGYRVFIPIVHTEFWYEPDVPFTMPYNELGTVSGWYAGWPQWAPSESYEYTGRYRAVCLTNLPSLLDDPPDPNEPWYY